MLDSQRIAVYFSDFCWARTGGRRPNKTHFPGKHSIPSRFWRIFSESDEADISTFEYQTQAQARFPRTHGHQGRSKDPSRSPCPWPRPTHPRLTPFPAQMTASGQHARFPKSKPARISGLSGKKANAWPRAVCWPTGIAYPLALRRDLASSPAGASGRHTFEISRGD